MSTDNETKSDLNSGNEINVLKRKIKNLERDLKTARHRIGKIKSQKAKLLEQIKGGKKQPIKGKLTFFFSEK